MIKTNTNAVRKQIKTVLDALCNTVSYEILPSPITYPYIVFSIRLIQEDYGRQQLRMEVDCVSQDTAEAESLADQVQDTFNHYNYIDENISLTGYIDQRDTITEEDKRVKRKKVTFQLDYYPREE